MRTTIVAIMVVLFAWMQFIFPAQIAPWHLVPDLCLLVVFAVALYYEPAQNAIWFALLAGLALDLWQPSHFGMWSLASMVVVLVTRLVHRRLLPRANWLSILVTAAIAIGLGQGIVIVREHLFSSAGLHTLWFGLVRIYLPRLIFDLLLVLPLSALIRSFLRALRASGDQKIILDHGSRR